jgi:WhiB family redox-sensing transcriptional regulator
MTDAACKGIDDPDIFYPDKNEPDRRNAAVALCFSCPVRAECREYRARTQTDYGIWGGVYTQRGTK